jgi:hypothetical protein
MASAKQLAANGASLKESTHSRTDGAKSPLAKLPAPSSAPEKVRTINVCLKRDALALVQVTAATAIPSHVNVTEQTKEVLVESAEALYEDFRTADPTDSILARLMCGISSMTMDSLSRGTWSQNLGTERDGAQDRYTGGFGDRRTHQGLRWASDSRQTNRKCWPGER